MLSIYHLEDGEYKFRGILAHNLKDEVVFSKAIANMKWKPEDVKVFCYDDDEKHDEFVAHYSSKNEDEILFAHADGQLDMCKITKRKEFYWGNVQLDNPYVLDYYTQEQIDKLTENSAAAVAFFEQNPEHEGDLPEGTFPHVIDFEEYMGEVITQKQETEVLKSIIGVEVDVMAKIAEESTPPAEE
jgi:hypothetical protein